MTDVPDRKLAPGCFGVGIVYSAEAKECSACPFAPACGLESAERLARVREKLGIRTPPPKPVEMLIASIERAGIKVVEMLRKGENPFKGSSSKFLTIACHLLLRMPDGVSRDLLMQTFMGRLGWPADKSRSHATHTMQYLVAIGAAYEFRGSLYLRKS